MVTPTEVSVLFLLLATLLLSVHCSDPQETNPEDPPSSVITHQQISAPPVDHHIIGKRFIPLPLIIPAIYPKKTFHFRFGVRKQYTPPILYRYKRFLPSFQALSQVAPTSIDSTITFLDGSHLWDNISAVLTLLQSLKQAIANIYQSSNLQAFLQWNRKALDLLARIGAFGIRFVPVQNNTMLFNLAPHMKFLIPSVSASVGINSYANADGVVFPPPIHQQINIVQSETHTISTPEPDILAIYTPRPITQQAQTMEQPLSVVKVNVGSAQTKVNVANTPVRDINVDIGRIFDTTNGRVNIGGEVSKAKANVEIDALEIDKSPLSTNLLGELKSSDRRKKRSLGFGPRIFARAQANFRRISPSFEGFSSNFGVYRQHPHNVIRHDVPKWQFQTVHTIKQHKVFQTSTEKSIDDIEVEEFNFLPHFENPQMFDSDIERINDKLVDYLQNINSVPFFAEENSFIRRDSDDSASDRNKVYVQANYAKPELAEYVDNVNVNYKALPNYEIQQQFGQRKNLFDVPIDPRGLSFLSNENRGVETFTADPIMPMRHSFVEAPMPIEESRPFVPKQDTFDRSVGEQLRSSMNKINQRQNVDEERRLFVSQQTRPFLEDQRQFIPAPNQNFEVSKLAVNEDSSSTVGLGKNTQEVHQTIDSGTFKPKNRYRKLPNSELNNNFRVVDPPNDLVRHLNGDANGRDFAMATEVRVNDDKTKIGGRVVYKRLTAEEEDKK